MGRQQEAKVPAVEQMHRTGSQVVARFFLSGIQSCDMA
jgi:hypothetical protein